MRWTVALPVALVLALLTGCSSRVADFTAVSTRNITMENMLPMGSTRGKHCVPVIFLPVGVPNIEEAIDRAIESGPEGTDMLTDVTVYSRNRSFLFGVICIEVTGTATDSSGEQP